MFDSWSRLFSDVYIGRTLFSLRLCLLVALLTTVVAFPFTWFLTRMRARAQVPLLVLVLGALTLSEVIVAFSWDLILGRATGITNIAVWAGLMSEPKAFTPGFWSVVAGLSYTSFPYAVLTLFPSLNRVDRELTEAAETLGASPARTFTTVVVPAVPPGAAGRVPAGVRVHPRQQHHRPGARPAPALDPGRGHLRPGDDERQRAVRGGHRHVPDADQPDGGGHRVVRRVAVVGAPARPRRARRPSPSRR